LLAVVEPEWTLFGYAPAQRKSWLVMVMALVALVVLAAAIAAVQMGLPSTEQICRGPGTKTDC
jgi:flagellar basal body-associated protein FliL